MFSSVCCGQCLFDINYNVCTLDPHSNSEAVIILCFGLELESDSSDTMCASVWSVLW